MKYELRFNWNAYLGSAGARVYFRHGGHIYAGEAVGVTEPTNGDRFDHVVVRPETDWEGATEDGLICIRYGDVFLPCHIAEDAVRQAEYDERGRCESGRGQNAVGHPDYIRLLDEMRDLHVRKAADYGRGVDPLANVRAAADFGIPAWVGVMIRANDKMHRIKSFLANGELKNESVEDSLKDLAAYALIALVLFRESQK